MSPIDNALLDLDRVLEFAPIRKDDPSVLTAAQIDQYNEEGYIFPLDVFDESEAAVNRAYFDDLMERAAAAGWDAYSINGWHKHCGSIHDLINDERILDYVEDLLGVDLVCWGTHYFCKLP